MPKIDWDVIEAQNAFSEGYADHPRQLCGYDYAKKPVVHTAYWAGWHEAAFDADDADREPYRIVEDEDAD